MGLVTLGGEKFWCDNEVLGWEDHGLRFTVGHGARKRRNPIDLFVAHWTGSENPPNRMFKTLQKRELGIEFSIDRLGVIWQFADPLELDTFDAGYINRRSVGCEIVNYGHRASRALVPAAGRIRDTYVETLHARRLTLARHFPAQLNALYALTECLIDSGTTEIQRQVPIAKRALSRSEVQAFSGVLGHFHVSRRKLDPGTDTFDMLAANGY